MQITILAFGIAKDIFSTTQLAIELPDNATVGDMKHRLETHFPRLAQISSYMVAVNNEYADNNVVLQPSHEIALIPPVSGG